MTPVLVWTVAGLAVGVVAPWLLRVMVRRGVDALVVLVVWAPAMCAALIAVALPALAEVVHRCWLALHDGPANGIDSVVGVLSAVAVAVAVARGGWRLHCIGLQRNRLYRRHLELAWLLGGTAAIGGDVLWLPAGPALAYSVAGDPPLVVLTSGVSQRLDGAAVQAVVAHERSHLRRGHHLLVAAADAAAAGMGWLPLMRQSPSLIRTVVELDADAQAAQEHGCLSLRRALQELSAMPAPAAALAISGECTQLRLARLQRPAAPRRGPVDSAALVCGAALLGTVLVFGAYTALTALATCATG